MELAQKTSYRTVMRILQSGRRVEERVNAHPEHKKSKNRLNDELEEVIKGWVLEMWDKGVFLSDVFIQEKGRECNVR